MANQVKLTAQTRSNTGRSAVTKLKQQGIVPAVIYGGKEPPQPLQVSARELKSVLSHASGENILVDLEITGDGRTANRTALIQEVQHHALSGNVLHVDFRAISMNEKITAEIPIDAEGEPTGVKNFGGILEQSMRSLEIECLPKDLPDTIRVDVSGLNIGSSIHVKHIILPQGVTALDDPDLTVFHVSTPKVEVEPVASEAPSAPEVIKEKKEEPTDEKAADKK